MSLILFLYRNIQVKKELIFSWLFWSFFIFTIVSLSYILINSLLAKPYAMIVELCISYNQEHSNLEIWKVLIIQSPNLFNFASIVVDIKLVRFLKDTIIPLDRTIIDQFQKISNISQYIGHGAYPMSYVGSFQTQGTLFTTFPKSTCRF